MSNNETTKQEQCATHKRPMQWCIAGEAYGCIPVSTSSSAATPEELKHGGRWDIGLNLWVCEWCDYAHEDEKEMVSHLCPGGNKPLPVAAPPSPSVEQELLAKLEKWIEGSKHKERCSFREWQCSQPGCAETHSTPCDCGKDALLSEVAAYRKGKHPQHSTSAEQELIAKLEQFADKIEGDPMLSSRTSMTRAEAANRVREFVTAYRKEKL